MEKPVKKFCVDLLFHKKDIGEKRRRRGEGSVGIGDIYPQSGLKE